MKDRLVWLGTGCMLATALGCGGALSPEPPVPPAPQPAVQSSAFDALTWWKALPPCIQKELLQTTKRTAPSDAVGVAPLLAVTQLRIYPTCEPKMESLEWIRPLVHLEDLMLNEQPVRDLSPLSSLVRLEKLDIHDWQLPAWPQDLTLPELEELSVWAPLPDLSFLGRHPKLAKLRLQGVKVANLEPLRPLKLEELSLENMNTADLGPLSGMTSLKRLYLYCYELPPADLAPLATLTGLQELTVAHHRGGAPLDLTPLSGLPLTKLTLQQRNLQSFEALSQISTLREVDLAESDLSSLAPLEALPLTSITLWGTSVSPEEIAAFRAAHPGVTVGDESPEGD